VRTARPRFLPVTYVVDVVDRLEAEVVDLLLSRRLSSDVLLQESARLICSCLKRGSAAVEPDNLEYEQKGTFPGALEAFSTSTSFLVVVSS
jgi:hypothetical protein